LSDALSSFDNGAMTAAVGLHVLREELALPLCTLRDGALRANSRALPGFLAALGARCGVDVALCPHGKTSMIPELWRRQLDDGCWGITTANAEQTRVAREAGLSRVMLANQLVGRTEIDWVAGELRADDGFAFCCFVDSVEGVERLAAGIGAAAPSRPLDVLLETGYVGGRCGVRTMPDAMRVARAIAASPRLRLIGVACYEGLLQTHAPDARDGAAAAVLRFCVEVARACDAAALLDDADPVVLSAGGSSFYDLAVRILAPAALDRPTRIVVRSGCYLTHDVGFYGPLFARLAERDPLARETGLRFTPALEVWASVLSVPEPRLFVLGAGRRDFGEDAGAPALVRHARAGEELDASALRGARIVRVNDQHAVAELPARADVSVGDLVALGPAHPCTTFDKWRHVHLVDDDVSVLDVLETRF
jgi:D-serine deaminase-like pyridoxal phosphate-dependent protein